MPWLCEPARRAPADPLPRRTRAARGAAVAATALVAALVGGRGAHAAGKGLDGVVNLNTAGSELLELLPGVGPAKVRSILWYRQRHPFRTVDELVRIKGIGRKMVRKLRPHLAVAGPTTAAAVRGGRGADPPAPAARPPPPQARPPPPRPAPPSGGRPAFARGAPGPWSQGAGRSPAFGAQGVRSRANQCLRPR